MNAAGGVNGNITYDSDSINEKKDYMSMIKEFMQLQYDSNNLSGYLSYKELYDYINDRTERWFNYMDISNNYSTAKLWGTSDKKVSKSSEKNK